VEKTDYNAIMKVISEMILVVEKEEYVCVNGIDVLHYLSVSV
jgi:hypothetical protein